ncbi:MAG TPA: hypothetical protein ENK54_00945 [Thiotrichales bacterium]|nr:hypothetical protein [Thiotrichales bacterium]
MKTALFLLVLLTRNGAGDIHAAFVEAGNRDACVARERMVRALFAGSGIPVVGGGCFESTLRFTPFRHAEGSRRVRHFYTIRLGEERVEILPARDWASCLRAARLDPAGDLLCAGSAQRLLR